MTTADPSTPFEWLSGGGCPLGEIFTVSFFRGLDPAEVVRRFGRGADRGRESGFPELMDRAAELSRGTGNGVVGVVRAGAWSVAVEPFGWRATLPDDLAELSRGCEVVAVTRHDYADDSFVYAIDGTLVTGYKPSETPHLRHGSEPDRLSGLMRQLGMLPDVQEDEDDDYLSAVPQAFALVAELTQVPFLPELLDRPMLAGSVVYL